MLRMTRMIILMLRMIIIMGQDAGSWLMAHGSWLKAHGSSLMAKGALPSPGAHAGGPRSRPGPAAILGSGARPASLGHGPRAMSLEP